MPLQIHTYAILILFNKFLDENAKSIFSFATNTEKRKLDVCIIKNKINETGPTTKTKSCFRKYIIHLKLDC